MRIGIIGCGYVFDHYMVTMDRHPQIEIVGVADIDAARLMRATDFYKLRSFESVEALLKDASIEVIVNLTSIDSHYEVTKASLLAGKHVYSEKPFVTDMAQAYELVSIANARGLRLSCAPSNALSATSQTIWRAVADGAIGDVRMVYAEFDDNPIYLMSPELWRSRSGAPWPYLHEYEMGCTWEHVGYHLTWMCAIFGPVRSVTAFSKRTLPDKTDRKLHPEDTPDFSVACLDFESGVVGRITCSISAPYDHRMRIIGNRGMVHADTYRHYECPVYLERFTKLTMNARKARSVRTNSFLQWIFGVGGKRVPLIGYAQRAVSRKESWSLKAIMSRFKANQLGRQDKTIGISELGVAICENRPHFPSIDFTLHLTELTLAIQSAGPSGLSQNLTTRFDPAEINNHLLPSSISYARYAERGWFAALWEGVLDRMHKH
jgi:predicted dehydrogenase